MLKAKQIINIKPQSQVYKDTYVATITVVANYSFTIGMPYNNGKVVLLSVGTMVNISIPETETEFMAEVIERSFSPVPQLVLQLPFQLRKRDPAASSARVITVTSGKGGVGKTSFSINLGIALCQLGYQTFIIDADLGTANVDILLNLQPNYNLTHILNKQKEILDIVVEGPGGIQLVPGGSGFQNIADLEDWQFDRLIASFQTLEKFADFIIIDTGAGLSKNVLNFILASDEVLLVTTPEPHAITDAYAIIKVMDERNSQLKPKLIINKSEDPEEAKKVSAKMLKVTERFLRIRIEDFGYILEDASVGRAIKKLHPFLLAEPQSPASQCVKLLAKKLSSPEIIEKEKDVRKNFFHRIKELFNR